MHIAIDPSVRNYLSSAVFAWTIYREVKVTPSGDDLKQSIQIELENARARLSLETLYDDPGIVESRRGFKALGLDPARYRPSQEALLRRALSDKPMYFINSGVDVCNLLSIRYRVPMGLYDVEKISGELTLKVGTSQDVYAALNERDVQCEQKLILCDAQGPIGGPYVDSKRTAITEATKTFLHVVYFCHGGWEPKAFFDMSTTVLQFHGGQAEGYRLLNVVAEERIRPV